VVAPQVRDDRELCGLPADFRGSERALPQVSGLGRMSRPIGRILSCRLATAVATIHLGSAVTGALVRPTRGLGRATLERPRSRVAN